MPEYARFNFLCSAAVTFALVQSSHALAQSVGLDSGPFTHVGMCEPSGAVPVEPGSFGTSFVVANDEDNVLRRYDATGDGGPIALGGDVDLNKFFGTNSMDDDQKADAK